MRQSHTSFRLRVLLAIAALTGLGAMQPHVIGTAVAQQSASSALAAECHKARTNPYQGSVNLEVVEGIEFVLLAEAPFDLNTGPLDSIEFRVWTFLPGNELPSVFPVGPTLYALPDTTFLVSLDGEVLDPQRSLPVDDEDEVGLLNTGSEPASVLGLVAAPLSPQLLIQQSAVTPAPNDIPSENAPSTEPLMGWDSPDLLAQSAMTGFVGCLIWDLSGVALRNVEIEGTVGLRVVEGMLYVSGHSILSEETPQRSCVPLAPGSIHNISAEGGPTVVLVFGYAENGTSAWRLTTENPNNVSVKPTAYDC